VQFVCAATARDNHTRQGQKTDSQPRIHADLHGSEEQERNKEEEKKENGFTALIRVHPRKSAVALSFPRLSQFAPRSPTRAQREATTSQPRNPRLLCLLLCRVSIPCDA
jgi:hypothetical protein